MKKSIKYYWWQWRQLTKNLGVFYAILALVVVIAGVTTAICYAYKREFAIAGILILTLTLMIIVLLKKK